MIGHNHGSSMIFYNLCIYLDPFFGLQSFYLRSILYSVDNGYPHIFYDTLCILKKACHFLFEKIDQAVFLYRMLYMFSCLKYTKWIRAKKMYSNPFCERGKIRTFNLSFRRRDFYPIELHAQLYPIRNILIKSGGF